MNRVHSEKERNRHTERKHRCSRLAAAFFSCARRLDPHFLEIFHDADDDHIDDGTAHHTGGGGDLLVHAGQQHAGILKITAVVNIEIAYLKKLLSAAVPAGNQSGVFHVGEGNGFHSHFSCLDGHFDGGGVPSGNGAKKKHVAILYITVLQDYRGIALQSFGVPF